MCSVIEPDTSIRQNMTACATGLGCGVEHAVADVERVDIRDKPGAPHLARELFFQLQAARGLLAVRTERGDLVAQPLQFVWPSVASARCGATGCCAPSASSARLAGEPVTE